MNEIKETVIVIPHPQHAVIDPDYVLKEVARIANVMGFENKQIVEIGNRKIEGSPAVSFVVKYLEAVMINNNFPATRCINCGSDIEWVPLESEGLHSSTANCCDRVYTLNDSTVFSHHVGD